MNRSSLCFICPRECGVDRNKNMGFCRAGNNVEIAWYGSHPGEEPPISGGHGSGTVFFCHCNLSCVYCQNWQISQKAINCKKITQDELVSIFFKLQDDDCHNINLVTPTIWSLQLIKVLEKAKKKGLKIPIVWNSNAYEKVESLKKLEGLIDIYLPDFKYSDENIAVKYSSARDYPDIAVKAITEMQRQVGDLEVDEESIARKGLIVRHLALPNYLENTRKCLEFIRSISEDIHLSLMSQYGPAYKASSYQKINRELTKDEYEKIKKMVEDLGFNYGWIQGLSGFSKCLNPDFSQHFPFGKMIG